ncbi:hypothetical protein DV736_g3579, partial [Chaetothyriales sp. CBS 134916]
MTKHNLSFSQAEASEQTTENLYRLGLLSRPRDHKSNTEHLRSPIYFASRRRSEESNPWSGSYLRSQQKSRLRSKQSNNPSTSLGHPYIASDPYRERRQLHGRQPPTFSPWPVTSVPGAGYPMAGMLEGDRLRPKRERTFVGGNCAACEERLEHTLRGERILQFSCGHVAHEACFYEYIKESDPQSQYCPTCDAPLGLDSFRGGSILDLSKLSKIVQSVAQNETSPRALSTMPMPWDRPQHAKQDDSGSLGEQFNRNSREASNRDSSDSQRMRIERLHIGRQSHSRNDSGNTSSAEFHQESSGHARRHDYDLHAMETSVQNGHPKGSRSPIPCPSVTLRSEFPTLTRSRQQQSLTCLVTIEVPEAGWASQHDELRNAPPVPPLPADPNPSRQEQPCATVPQPFGPFESRGMLEEITRELRARVDNWHGLEFQRFGNLRLRDFIRVGKDRQSWQELECYLFGEMLICIKEKKAAQPIVVESGRQLTRCTLKGSILIKKHLRRVQALEDENILTLNLSVAELPTFYLQFKGRSQLDLWRHALLDLHAPVTLAARGHAEYEPEASGTDDEEYSRHNRTTARRAPSVGSSYGGPKSATTAPTEYSSQRLSDRRGLASLHVPVDMVVVIPVSSSMQGLKIQLLKDTLRFLVHNLGERDRMGLVTFGSSGGGVPLVGMATNTWDGWDSTLSSIKPVGQKSLRADVVEGANVAMDLLMQRQAASPISTILLISDSSMAETESVDFVLQRAEAANLIELSSRTKGSYLYVKDWMMLRDAAAGVLGSLQSTSHQNVKLRLKLPEGSPAKFYKISGALQTTKRATGRDAEAALGDLRFGDKRDVLIQLNIDADTCSQAPAPQDAWESLLSSLEALGGGVDSGDDRIQSVEEVPLLLTDLSFSDPLRDGRMQHLPRPTLLAITMLPASPRARSSRSPTPPIPPHPHIVQRRMELLASDMLSRALGLVSRGQHDRAQHLLIETRTILKGLGKGSLPPLPPNAGSNNSSKRHSPPDLKAQTSRQASRAGTPERGRDNSPHSDSSTPIPRASGIDPATMNALDADIEASLEWINHPAIFLRDSRKAVLQAIGVIASQRGYTFRTASESLWADRIVGVKRLIEQSREWREADDESLAEE